MNTTAQNLENIEAFALYIDKNMRLAEKQKRLCRQMLEQYVKEEYNIVLDESVITLEDDTRGTSYFSPDAVNFEVEDDGRVLIVLGGTQHFPGDKHTYFVGIALHENMKKEVIYRVEDLPILLGKES